MSESKHTPSPWRVVPADESKVEIFGPGGMVAIVRGSYLISKKNLCNANLIAAAPDLLKSLLEVLDQHNPFESSATNCECSEFDGSCEDDKPGSCVHTRAWAAINKTHGK